METKKLIRKQVLALRDGMDPDLQIEKSHDIMEKCVSHFEFLQAENILIFASFGSEVRTMGIIQYAFLLGKKVFCPRIEHGEMHFVRIFAAQDLQPGFHGISEPSPDNTEKWQRESDFKTLMILPGLAFTKDGERLGYGGGFYDSFLAKGFCGTKMAICFSEQVLSAIPVEEHDATVDYLITEDEVLECEPFDFLN